MPYLVNAIGFLIAPMPRLPLHSILLLLCLVLLPLALNAQVYDITRFGAKPDARTNNAGAIQQAIDACAKTGGQVLFPAGVFLTGTLRLKSNVTIYLSKNAVLKGMPDLGAFPSFTISYPTRPGVPASRALLVAENQQHIALTGEGTFDGNGEARAFQDGKGGSPNRPYGLLLVSCQDVLVSGVTLRSAAHWMQRYLNCDRVRVQGIRVFNHANLNGDGLDIDDSHDVLISDCQIDATDDAICLKSEGDRGCADVTVTNCILSSHASGFKLGTGSIGGFRRIAFNNSIIRPSKADSVIHPFKVKGGLVGIDLHSVDGGTLADVTINNIIIDSVETPIVMRLGNRLGRTAVTPANKVGQFKNVLISQIIARNAGKISSFIAGYPGHYIENVTLRDVFIESLGGGLESDREQVVPENSASYPVNRMFGMDLTSYGFFVRHVRNIRFDNVQLTLMNPDARYGFVLDDVERATLTDVASDSQRGYPTLIRLANSRQIDIRGRLTEQQSHIINNREGVRFIP